MLAQCTHDDCESGMACLVVNNSDILEAGIVEGAKLVVMDKELAAHGLTTVRVQLAPGLEDGLGVSGAVVADEVHVGLARLDPAAGGAAAEGLLEEAVPILDGTEEVADVDEVEVVVLPGPRQGGVVDLEPDVGRDPLGLAGREIGADDVGGGELVGKVTGRCVSGGLINGGQVYGEFIHCPDTYEWC